MTSLCSPDAINGHSSRNAPPWVVDEREGHPPVTYNEFLTLVNTGDLFVEYGRTTYARVIEAVGQTKFSHIGMFDVIKVGEGQQMQIGAWVFESVQHADCIDINGVRKSGVRTVELGERIRCMSAARRSAQTVQIGVISLLCRPPTVRDIVANRLHHFSKLCNQPYERHIAELGRAAFPGWFGKPVDDKKSMFCSELIMHALIACGIVRSHDHQGRATVCSVNLHALTNQISLLPYTEPNFCCYEPKMTVYHVLLPGQSRPSAVIPSSPPPSSGSGWWWWSSADAASQQQSSGDHSSSSSSSSNRPGWFSSVIPRWPASSSAGDNSSIQSHAAAQGFGGGSGQPNARQAFDQQSPHSQSQLLSHSQSQLLSHSQSQLLSHNALPPPNTFASNPSASYATTTTAVNGYEYPTPSSSYPRLNSALLVQSPPSASSATAPPPPTFTPMSEQQSTTAVPIAGSVFLD